MVINITYLTLIKDMAKNGKSYINTISLIISGLALVVSGVIAILCLPSSHRVDFDYQGLLVGILSLLVTVLIGWQIWLAFDLKGYDQKIDALHKKTVKENEKLKGETYMVLANNFLANVYPIRKNNDMYYFIIYSLYSIVYYSAGEDYKYCVEKIGQLSVAPLEKLSISREDKERLVGIASLVANKEKINNYNSLLKWILSLPVID